MTFIQCTSTTKITSQECIQDPTYPSRLSEFLSLGAPFRGGGRYATWDLVALYRGGELERSVPRQGKSSEGIAV